MKPDPRFHIPQDLSPHTAMALFELLSGFTDALWQHYETELVELITDELNQLPDAQQSFDFHDEPPC